MTPKFNFTEPVVLIGEGEYNLNNLKEIDVTESFLGLPKQAKGCQNIEPFNSCTSRHYITMHIPFPN